MAQERELLTVRFDTVLDKNVEQLKALNRAIFPINYQDRIYSEIVACGDVSQLAYHNDELGIKLYIITLGVLAPYRSMGAGAQLLRQSLAAAARMEAPRCVEAYLHVQVSNTEAVSFYEREGFYLAEILRGYYPRLDPPDAALLRRTLP